MEEEILIRYFNDNCTPQEEQMVLQWANENEQNKETFIKMKNLFVSQSMPLAEASDAEYREFRKNIIGFPVKFSTIFRYTAAAIAIILLALNLHFNWIAKEPKEATVRLADLPQECVNTIYTVKGVKGEVQLPDGSKVWLNSDSKITYPTHFSGASREIEFSGEGYFNVIKDSLRPMIVRCNKNFRIEVYGTTFNVKSYDNEETAQATLYSGTIHLVEESGGKEKITNILPDESYIIQPGAKPKNIKLAEPEIVSAWKEGNLIFDSTTLKEAIKTLERWHGVTINVENPKLLSMHITANFKSESIVQILELLKFSIDFNYQINENVVTIR